MKKSTIMLMAALAISVFLGGCAIRSSTHSRAAEPAPAQKGNFCPPGQAKKGNC